MRVTTCSGFDAPRPRRGLVAAPGDGRLDRRRSAQVVDDRPDRRQVVARGDDDAVIAAQHRDDLVGVGRIGVQVPQQVGRVVRRPRSARRNSRRSRAARPAAAAGRRPTCFAAPKPLRGPAAPPAPAPSPARRGMRARPRAPRRGRVERASDQAADRHQRVEHELEARAGVGLGFLVRRMRAPVRDPRPRESVVRRARA